MSASLAENVPGDVVIDRYVLALALIAAFLMWVGLVVFGMSVLVVAGMYRTRAHHNYWVTCRFSPVDGTIVVEPTHRRFDEAARDLFVRSLR